MFTKQFEIIRSEGKYFSQLKDFQLFTCLSLQYFYSNGEIDVANFQSSICDGSKDGGIDFLLVDPEDEMTLIVGQTKHNLSGLANATEVQEYFSKMSKTVDNLKNGKFSFYSNSLQKQFLNCWDSLGISESDKNPHIKLVVFLACEVGDAQKSNINKFLREDTQLSKYECDYYDGNDIKSKIEETDAETPWVPHDKIVFFNNRGMIKYNDKNDKLEGLLVNISANSLRKIAIKHMGKGLFEQNFRYFIDNKNIDGALKQTLSQNRDGFWYLNNGIIIGCHDFYIDGNTIKLENFSIINGCQTTTLISKDSSIEEGKDFEITCKIIKVNNADQDYHLIEDIAEASNSQKPIKSRDLKSNRREQRRLKSDLNKLDPKLYLLIKRGQEKKERKRIHKYEKIDNEKLGQLILAFNFQQPGTARNNKSKIFNVKEVYSKIFERRGNEKPERLQNMRELVDLYYKILEIKKDFMNRVDLEDDLKIILRNSELSILAIIGFIIKIQKGLLSKNTTESDWLTSLEKDNLKGKIFSDYKGDDFDVKLKALVEHIIQQLSIVYTSHESKFTSVSNLFKTDSNYRTYIIKSVLQQLKNPFQMKTMEQMIDIFDFNEL